jgi:hypothetical protein
LIDCDLLSGDQYFESTKGRPKFKSSIIQAGWILKTVYGLTFCSLLGLLFSNIKASDYALFCSRGNEVASISS